MAVDKNLVLTNGNATLGEIVIAPEVIEIIIGIAASKVKGVYAMRGNFSANMTELFGGKSHRKGVYLEESEEGLKVDVYCYLNYGVSVPKVAMDMQDKVKEQLIFMTDLELVEVNVHVVGVVPEKTENIDLEALFAESEEDE